MNLNIPFILQLRLYKNHALYFNQNGNKFPCLSDALTLLSLMFLYSCNSPVYICKSGYFHPQSHSWQTFLLYYCVCQHGKIWSNFLCVLLLLSQKDTKLMVNNSLLKNYKICIQHSYSINTFFYITAHSSCNDEK